MDPVTIAMLALQLAPMIAGPLASAVPGPMEEGFRKDVEAERDALRTWQGGMTSAQRDRLRNEGLSALQAQQQAQLSALARGAANSDGGTAGVQGAAMRDVARIGASAQNQLESGVRQQDVDLYNLRRRQNREDVKHAIELGWRRKMAALNAAGIDTGYQQGESMGQGARQNLASLVAKGVPATGEVAPDAAALDAVVGGGAAAGAMF